MKNVSCNGFLSEAVNIVWAARDLSSINYNFHMLPNIYFLGELNSY